MLEILTVDILLKDSEVSNNGMNTVFPTSRCDMLVCCDKHLVLM